ncbi:CASP-like protein 4D1 [Prunus yedoensis var. nudiflora]|uniref:CASP-like protein n=1 Tax=Prunus yedoensis var. nudiflora TaxID=2094558 RepID=A0A314YMB8_PRUYE|nr:CASP-like protein 4D1 [Prunus yedoensis var. nudiflora]
MAETEAAAPLPPPPSPFYSSVSSRLASLILRIIAFILLLISLIVLGTNTMEINQSKLRFQDIYAYRYMLSTIVIGTAYSLLQLALSIQNVVSGQDGILLLNFFGDKLISYLLASGTGAGFAITVDTKRLTDADPVFELIDIREFYDKAYASASLLLLAFCTTAMLSIISSYTLPKRV